MTPKVALSIAGSDPSGGAGIQADLHAFYQLGVHGVTVVSCVTAQNSKGVQDMLPISVESIRQQIACVAADFDIAAVKTGMLYDASVVDCVSTALKRCRLKPVVDPVIIASSGDSLSQDDLIHSLKTQLIPQAQVVTPNVTEAACLTDTKIADVAAMETAAEKIHSLGPQYVLITGGDLSTSESVDVLYDGNAFHQFSLPRINRMAHGTGCTFSALLTGVLAHGFSVPNSVAIAKQLLWGMIKHADHFGTSIYYLPTSSHTGPPPNLSTHQHASVWCAVQQAITVLQDTLPAAWIPEVGSNLAFAIPNAHSKQDICALAGRIIKADNTVRVCGRPDFGVSQHAAGIVLAAMHCNKNIRAAMNIRYSSDILAAGKKNGMVIGTFNRKDEPKSAGSTMEWGTKKAIETLDHIPDIIYDTGAVGKEPMIRILADAPQDVLTKLNQLLIASNHQ